MRKWVATVHFKSEIGDLDVDFVVNDLSDLDVLIRNSFGGYECIGDIEVKRVDNESTTMEDKLRTYQESQKQREKRKCK